MVICLERVSDDLSDVFCAMQVLVFSSTPWLFVRDYPGEPVPERLNKSGFY